MKGRSVNRLSEAEWDRLVGRVYDAALHPERWGEVILDIGRPLNAHAGQLVVLANDASTHHYNVLVGVEPEGCEQFDALIARGEHVRANFVRNVPELSTATDYLHTTEAEMKRSAFYQEHAIPYNVPYYGATIASRRKDAFIASVVLRSKRWGHLDDIEVDYLNRLAPHIRRSLELSLRLYDFGAIDGALSVLSRISAAAVIIDRRFAIQATNDKAARLLSLGDGLFVAGRFLRLTNGVADRQLESEIAHALGLRPSARLKGSGRIRAPRPSGKASYVLCVTPLADMRGLRGPRQCLVMIIDPDEKPRLPKTVLKREYDLTAAECDVAVLLAEGLSIKEVALRRRTSVETVRAQLKRIFMKTNCSHQGRLVSTLLRHATPLPM